jgi:hypothetical protein
MMASNPSDQPTTGVSSGLSRSVTEATERIHEIIDAAEKVASEIRAEAEAEAEKYLADRRREADRAVEERTESLDRLTKTLADTGEQFKHQAERMLADLDRAIADARAGVYRHGAIASLDDEPAEPPAPEPVPDPPSFDSGSLTPERPPLSSLGPDDDPIELPPLDSEPLERPRPAEAAVAAYPGRVDLPTGDPQPAAGGDQSAEALLRATQLAVTGKNRDEIADVLRTDFPGVDTEPLLDEILG